MNTVTKNKNAPLKLIIIGGGYAGLSALITMRKQAPDAEITLIDPRPYHLIITRLHDKPEEHEPFQKQEGSRYFCERFFRASCSKNQQKITRPPMPSAAPIRPRHLVSTQQGVET